MNDTDLSESLLELLVQWDEARREGKSATPEELAPGNERLQSLLRERIEKRQRMEAALDLPDDTRSEPVTPAPGKPHVAGYKIGALLGRGGMGVVYKAQQETLQRNVALKMVISGANAGSAERARFRTEAEAVARLQHPNIVQIFEVGEQAGCPYLALEFCGGGSLAQQIVGKPVTVRRAAQLVLELARAVQHAHEQGILHRDLKPANVLMTESGVVKIADFGLAKRMDDESGNTHTGAVLGSPSYMAPEQAEGKVRSLGRTTDVYALGAILYELLTGRPPFVGDSFLDTLDQVRHHDPAPPQSLQPKVPTDLSTICLKCLEKKPSMRYESAAALAADLDRFLRDEPITARNASFVDQFTRLLRHSHVNLNFGAWAKLAFAIAPVPLIAHSIVFLLLRNRPEYPFVALGVSMATVFLALSAMFLGGRVKFSVIPVAQRRPLQSAWVGHVIGFVLIPWTVYIMVRPTTLDDWFLIYALWLIQVGGTFFALAANAGFMYLTAGACYTLALLVPWMSIYTPLVVGVLMSTNMTAQAFFLRSLAKEAALEADSRS